MDKANHPSIPITAVVTAYKEAEIVIATLKAIFDCVPRPDEVLVHVDGNEEACARRIREAFPSVKTFVSQTNIGPGGGRNTMARCARNELIASFDDDSYPYDEDYFARALAIFYSLSDASVITGSLFHPNESVPDLTKNYWEVGTFLGGACIFRKSHIIDTGGYIPVPLAYGIEEEDMSLRLINNNRRLYKSECLRVYHNTELKKHATPEITAASISNIGLRIYLRYPLLGIPYGVLQVANRIAWCLKNRRPSGILTGLVKAPILAWKFRYWRAPVSLSALFQKSRRQKKKIQYTLADHVSQSICSQ